MSETVLVLRCSKSDGSSFNNFKWPNSGPVECSDWDPVPDYGNGLHGLLWGQYNKEIDLFDQLLYLYEDPLWYVVEVLKTDLVPIRNSDTVKFPRGNVIYCGDLITAAKIIFARNPVLVVGLSQILGHNADTHTAFNGTTLSGDGSNICADSLAVTVVGKNSKVNLSIDSQAIVGSGSRITGRHSNKILASYSSNITVVDRNKIIVYDNSIVNCQGPGNTVIGADRLIVNGGPDTTVKSDDMLDATIGHESVVLCGKHSRVTCGKNCVVVFGPDSRVSGKEHSVLVCRYFDRKREIAVSTAIVGKDGIEPDVEYVVDSSGKFIKAGMRPKPRNV